MLRLRASGMIITFCRTLQDQAQCSSEVPQWGRFFCCCLNSVSRPPLFAWLHHLWRPCTVQIDFFFFFYQRRETNSRNPVLSHSCNIFRGLLTSTTKNYTFVAVSFIILTLIFTLFTWTPEANIVCLWSSSKVSSWRLLYIDPPWLS